MGKYLAGFLLGTLIGIAAVPLFGVVVWECVGGSDWLDAKRESMSRENFAAWQNHKLDSAAELCLFGVVCCGALGAVGFNRPIGAAGRRSRRRLGGSDEPLSRDEFQQVLQACVWMPIDARSPEYVRGLVVGRLAENQPALAKRVDGVSDHLMDMLYRDLCRRRARGI
jgi:hypothetical protein